MRDAHHHDAPERAVGLAITAFVGLDPAAGLARAVGTGATPHRCAQAASDWSRSGLSPAAITSAAAVSGPTPKRSSRSGTVATSSDSIRSSSSASSRREPDAMGQRRQRRLGRSGDRIGRSRRPQLGSFGDERRHRQPFKATTEPFRCAVAEVAHLDQSLDPGLAGRALRHDENPDGLDGAVSGLGLAARPTTEGGPSCFDGIERVGLAAAAALVSIRSVDLYDVYAHPLEVTGQARSIGAGSFDADLGDAAKVLEPRHQGLVAGGVGGETLGAEQPTERVQCGCDMDVAVRIDTTGIPRAASTMVMVIPFSQSWRDGTAVPDRSDGRSGLF